MNMNLPALTYEEEKELFRKYKLQDCLKSAEKIVRHHLGLVNSMAHKMRNYNLPHEDLFQEGVIGLMKAVKSYDINRENRFVSYAMIWIRSQMLEFVENNISLVKRVTTHAKSKLFYNLRKHTKHVSLKSTDIKMIAEQYDVSEEDVREMELTLYIPDSSLDVNVEDDSDDTFVDVLVGDEDNQYIISRMEYDKKSMLEECLSILSEKEKKIIEMRYLIDKPIPRKDIGIMFGVSQQAIEQTENVAVKKMKKYFTSNGNVV